MSIQTISCRTLTESLDSHTLEKDGKKASFCKVNRQTMYVQHMGGGGWMKVTDARKLWKELLDEGWVQSK